MTTPVDCDKPFDFSAHIHQKAANKGDTLSAVKENIKVAEGYKTIISPGLSELQLMHGALGSRQFRSTPKLCEDEDGNKVKLYLFQNHQPSCYTPDGLKKDCGLAVGLKESIDSIGNSLGGLLHVFDTSTKKCTEVTIDVLNGCGSGPQKAHIENDVAKDIDPCFFTNRVNPITNEKCSVEGFSVNTKNEKKSCCCTDMPKDPVVKMYYTSLGLLMLFILLKMTFKKK